MLAYELKKHSESEEWVVLIHGFGGNRRMWKTNIQELEERYNILNIDLPGHGESEGVVSSEIFSHSVAGIKEILDKEGIDKAFFTGVSIGTVVALMFCIKHREYVKGLVLCGAVVGINGFGAFALSTVRKIRNLLPYKLTYKITAFVIMPHKDSKDARKLFIKSASRLGKVQFDSWIKALMQAKESLPEFLSKAEGVAKTFIMGDRDSVFLDMLDKFREKIDYAREVIMIEKCGHVCNLDKPKEFNRLVIEFIEKVRLCGSVAHAT